MVMTDDGYGGDEDDDEEEDEEEEEEYCRPLVWPNGYNNLQ
jgi:hypothetical protein